MDGLRELARTFDQEQQFWYQHEQFQVISISSFPTKQTMFQHAQQLDFSGVRQLLESETAVVEGEAADATLRLLVIRREDNEDIQMERAHFMGIFDSFAIDPQILYLIARNSYGFHTFGVPEHRPPLPTTAASPCSFFLGTVLFNLIWTFDPAEMKTRALLLPRRSNGLTNGTEAVQRFSRILRLYRDHIRHPSLLAFTASIHMIHFVDKYIMAQLEQIREIEAYTGHGAWNNPGSGESDEKAEAVEPGEITRRSGIVGACLVNLANQLRHENIIASLVDFVLDEQRGQTWVQQIRPECRGKHDASLETFVSVGPLLRSQVKNGISYVHYLQERYRSQSTVLFGLLTHHDATSSIRLPDASKDLAEAAKRDSSAMKTIAVMSMAFLPGTFFAALFAVPTLQWGETPVIQPRFRIYWAFTIPATVLIFLVWMMITNWTVLMKALGRNGDGEGSGEVSKRSSRRNSA